MMPSELLEPIALKFTFLHGRKMRTVQVSRSRCC